MDKRLLEFAVEIVQAQVSMSKMSAEEIESTLLRVYNALYRMHQAEQEHRSIELLDVSNYGPEPAPPDPLQPHASESMDFRSSIQDEKVTCLECGSSFRQLTANHLRTHHLTPRDYKRKWGFPLKQPLAARVLTDLRSQSAKQRGLPPKLQQYLEDRRQSKEVSNSEDAGKTQPHSTKPSRRKKTA